MAGFDLSFRRTMRTEGTCNFSPNDKGNVVVSGVCVLPTYAGIAPKFHPHWKGFAYIKSSIASMKSKPQYGTAEFTRWKAQLDKLLAGSPVVQNLVKAFYKATFWDAYRLTNVKAQEVADWCFDHLVNAGGRGARWAQLAAKVKPDGDIGPVSIAAINAMPSKEFLERAADISGKHRLDVAEGDPTQIPFLTSWLTRDGQPQEVIAMVKAAAKDGRIDEREVSALTQAMEATA
jgi:hypothetical protein